MYYLKKNLLRLISVGIILFGCVCAFVLLEKYSEIYHPIGAIPRGVNVSLYSEEFSRGFSWWTKSSKNAETKLYISEVAFGETDFPTAVKASADLDSQHFGGILVIEGQSKSIQESTRWGKLFRIDYCNHTVAVENLHPAQIYHYALGGNGEYIFGKFKTDSDNKTVIINLNDFQTNDGEKLYMGSDTVAAALQCTGDSIDFFAFGGDFTSIFSLNGKQYSYFPGWIKSMDSLEAYISGIPMVMAPGNHDATKDLFVSNNMINYAGTSDTGGYWSFDYNNVHFAVLNSNEFDDNQFVWIQEDLAQANAKKGINWIILMIHAGPYTTGDHGFYMENAYIETIGRLASEYHVDVVMQAHDHTFSKTYPYCWDSMGFTENVLDRTVINRTCHVEERDGIKYDCDPQGTYYISCGAMGHHLGENADYARSQGKNSYANRFYKVAISSIMVDSEFADIGMPASMDLEYSMFGVLQIHENTLVYDFYAVVDEKPVWIDRLAVMKAPGI